MEKIKKLIVIIMGILVFSLPYVIHAGQTPVPSNSDCDTGCVCTAGSHAGVFGCWGSQKWCTVDCREKTK